MEVRHRRVKGSGGGGGGKRESGRGLVEVDSEDHIEQHLNHVAHGNVDDVDVDDDVKYHSLPEHSSSHGGDSQDAAGWLQYVTSYFVWFYELIPSWQSFSSYLFSSSSSPPFVVSEQMQRRVDAFKTQIAVAWDENNDDHLQLLRRYWAASFPEAKEDFQRKSKRWGDVGFQGVDPGTDFRGAGMLGLKHLVYFAEHHHDDFQRMLSSGYPVSVAGLNVTMMLYQFLGWGFKRIQIEEDKKRVLYEFLFQDDDVIEDERLERVLYTSAFRMLDEEWRKINATYMMFPVVIQNTQQRFLKELPQIIERAK